MRLRTFIASSFALLLAAGCGADGQPRGGASQGALASPIINGQLDTTHAAVTAIVQVDGKGNVVAACSGTIVQVVKDTGFLLTAAHCVLPVPNSGVPNPQPSNFLVIQGDDWATAKLTYPVSAFKVHPGYAAGVAASPYDFAMVTFLGAGPSTPVIPALSPAEDKLAVGTKVNLIGYGKTSPAPNNSNTKRYAITLPLSSVSPLQFSYSEKTGGTCQGDSGGPGLVTVGGAERVAGVSSFVVDGCAIEGTSGRVSAVYDWMQGYVSGSGGTGTQTCGQCAQAAQSGAGACVAKVDACFADAACKGLIECENKCTTEACFQGCQKTFAAGAAKRNEINACLCDTACSTQCAMECSGPACGFSYQDAGCGTCAEASCCDVGAACAKDPACAACATTSNPAPSCQQNAAYTAFTGCLGSKCAGPDKCGGAKCGFSFNDATCGGCIESSCCDAAAACANDATCNPCFTSKTPPAGCDANPLVQAFDQCLSSTCGKACGGSQCGFSAANATCQACFEAKCCAQSQACFDDTACRDCATGKTSGPACDANQKLADFFGCNEMQCAKECGSGSGGGAGGGINGAGGASGTTGFAGSSSQGGKGGFGTGFAGFPTAGASGVGGSGDPGLGGAGGEPGAGGEAGSEQGGGQGGEPGAGGDGGASGKGAGQAGASGKGAGQAGVGGKGTGGSGGAPSLSGSAVTPVTSSDVGGCSCQVPVGAPPGRALGLVALGVAALLRRRPRTRG